MRVNKFGSPLEYRDDDGHESRAESVRNFVRNTALCLSSASEYDARERSIHRLAEPRSRSDATTRNYADGVVRREKETLAEEIRRTRENVDALRSDLDEYIPRSDADSLAARLTAVEETSTVLTANSVSLLDHRDSMLRELTKLRESVRTTLPRVIANVNSNLSESLRTVNAAVETLRNDTKESLDALRSDANARSAAVETLRNDAKESFDALRSDANARSARVAALEDTVQNLKTASRTLFGYNDVMVHELAKLKELLAERSKPARHPLMRSLLNDEAGGEAASPSEREEEEVATPRETGA